MISLPEHNRLLEQKNDLEKEVEHLRTQLKKLRNIDKDKNVKNLKSQTIGFRV